MKKLLLSSAIILLMVPALANATLYSFTNITNNGNADLSGQLSVDVTQDGSQVDFKFLNNVGIASSITQIYFDSIGSLMTYNSFVESSGVSYSTPATPGNLPGGNPISFFADFSAGPNSPVSPNGINSASEYLTIVFDLYGTTTFGNILSAINSGTLSLGLHVQSIGLTGGSDSYVNGTTPVPEPATMLLFGTGLVGLAGLARRKN